MVFLGECLCRLVCWLSLAVVALVYLSCRVLRGDRCNPPRVMSVLVCSGIPVRFVS